MKLLIFTLALIAHANTPPVADDSKPLELPSFSATASGTKKDKGLTVSMSCKTVDGTEVKQGEAGYDACLSQVQMAARPENDRHSGSAQSTGNSANLNFKFGN